MGADALSKPNICQILVASTAPSSLFLIPLSYFDMAKEQQTDPSMLSLKKSSSLSITSIPITTDLSLLADIFMTIFHPLVPLSFQKLIFDHMHSLGHP